MAGLLNFLPPQTCYLLFGFKLPFYFQYFLLAFLLYKPLSFLLQNKYFRILVIFLAPLVILVNLLRNGFFFQSDDFAHLKIAAEYSFGEIFSKAMGPSGLWGFHHIFIGLWLFKIIFLLFGSRVEAYVLVNFFLHVINLGLLYLILSKINKQSLLLRNKSNVFNLFGTFLFACFYLSWISSIWELTMAIFVLLAVFFWLNWLSFPENKYLFLTIFAYLLALLSYEKSALLPIVLFLISIFYHSLVAKINFKRVLLSLSPFFLISLIHFLIYGKIYLDFFNLGGGDGYSSEFSYPILLKNFSSYLTLSLPIINSLISRLAFFILILVIFDFWQKKLVLLPLFFSYFVLLSPALFFEHKIASYYAYTPSIFLYILFSIFLTKVYSLFHQILKRRKLILKVSNIYFALFIGLGVFKLDRFFLDNCFLIHYPWPNPHRIALNSISQKLNNMFQEGKIEEGTKIKLEENELTHEMKYLFTTNALYLFLDDKDAINYTFLYDKEEESLVVKSEPCYQKISF